MELPGVGGRGEGPRLIVGGIAGRLIVGGLVGRPDRGAPNWGRAPVIRGALTEGVAWGSPLLDREGRLCEVPGKAAICVAEMWFGLPMKSLPADTAAESVAMGGIAW